MKASLFILLAALRLAGPASAQQLAAARVPAAAVAAFHHAFPAAKAAKWETEGTDYEAGFVLGTATMSAVITAAGELRETETGLAPAQLPAPVRQALGARYAAYRVTEAAKIVTAATGATTYEAEVSRGGQHRDVLFRADGTEVPRR